MSKLLEGSRRLAISSQDRGSIVLDIGKVYTKIGMSGESSPRHIITSEVTLKPYGQVYNIWNPKYLNREELYLILCKFMQGVYLKYMMVNPKDYRVVVVESLFAPLHFRNTLAKVLFHHFNVPFAAFIPSHLMCVYTLGKQTALVVDIGVKETTVLPVYEGTPIVAAWQSTSIAAEAVNESLKAMLMETCTLVFTNTGEEKPLSAVSGIEVDEKTLEDIIVRTCFVRPYNTDPKKVPPSVKYFLHPQHSVVIKGFIRDHCTDVLFDSGGGFDLTVTSTILESLMQCSIDVRRELSQNILIVGGISTLPGFKFRLQQELTLLQNNKCLKYHKSLSKLSFRFHNPPTHGNSVPWLGGSLFGASEIAVLERAVSREKFKEQCVLPDWLSCDPGLREKLNLIPTKKLLPSTPSVRPQK